MTEKLAYKILCRAEFAVFQADGHFAGAANDLADGFIHLSTEAQLGRTLDRYFAGAEDLYLVAVDLGAAGELVRWEASSGGDLYPHLYAPLTRSLVVASGALQRDATGEILLPVPR